MIGTSLSEYIFIRACIFGLHYLVPFGSICATLAVVVRPFKQTLPLLLETYVVAETGFLFLVYFPRRYILQRPAIHPPSNPRQKRRELFDACRRTIQDHEPYLSKWFQKGPLSEVKRDNLKDFFCWAFLNKGAQSLLDDEELDEYVCKFEKGLGRELEAGKGTAVPLRLTVNEVKMMHRPLLWYLVGSFLLPTEETHWALEVFIAGEVLFPALLHAFYGQRNPALNYFCGALNGVTLTSEPSLICAADSVRS